MKIAHARKFLFAACCAVLFFFTGCDRAYHVKTETVHVKSPEQIVPLTGPLVKPVLYTHISGLEKLSISRAKAKFIAAILPSILVARFEINQLKIKMEHLRDLQHWNSNDSVAYRETKVRYRARDMDDLLMRMEMLPVSVVIAQAAVESGWGKSRIFIRANNLFGVWSYSKHEPRIPALIRRENRRIYLRSYADISQSITHYFEIIGRVKSYRKLREKMMQTDAPMQLLPYLKNFSERRSAYTRQLKTIIMKNDLMKYDHYEIDPAFIIGDK